MNIFKILIAGSFSSGKTTFIRCISEIDVISTELPVQQNPPPNFTIALDFGRVTGNETTVLYFFGTPGARRFDVLLSDFLQPPERSGMVMMVDAQKPETYREAQSILALMRQWQRPYILAANYRFPSQPQPTLYELREVLQLQADELILPFYGRKLDSSMITLELLTRFPPNDAIQTLIQRIETINQT